MDKHSSEPGRHQYNLCFDLFLCVFACFSLTLVGQQIRHHKTSSHHPSSSSSTSIPSSLLCPLLQGPETLRGLQFREPVLSFTAACCHRHPLPILCLYSCFIPSQSSSCSFSNSSLLPNLCLLLPPCPGSTSAIGI